MPSSAPLIKGYLPVRLKLPDTSHTREGQKDATFFFVREHQSGNSGSEGGGKSKSNSTLFVANAPVVPGISTKILLKSIFGRFGDISRVTVIEHPRQIGSDDLSDATRESRLLSTSWSTKVRYPSFLKPIHSKGKFAHVVFTSSKEMRRAMKALNESMRHSSNHDDDDADWLPGLTLEKIEIQTLSDETDRQYDQIQKKVMGDKNLNDDDDYENEFDDDEDNSIRKLDQTQTGILAVAAQYRASLKANSRAMLLDECNAVMEAYEDAEEASRLAKEAAKSQPDDDGFVTVSYTAAVGSKVELEDTAKLMSAGNRRRGQKRNRKKKQITGADELTDFYRFQRRDNRKRSLEDLRKQFEEDLKKVKKLKEERKYRPF